jgi:hypothetical protein
MKLAVLLYGQPRFWDLSHESIIQETTFENSTTDYYFHFWDQVAYGHNDWESGGKLTQEDKDKIVSIYKPRKHLFTDYSPLEKVEEEVFKMVEGCKDGGKMEPLNLAKSIFEVCEPEHLRYYLGQFVSLQQGAELIDEEYDYIFRVRTDVLFVTPDMYEEERFYKSDKQLFYHRLHKKEKGIFCKYGDLQIWEGAYNTHDRIETPTSEGVNNEEVRKEVLGALSELGAFEDHQPKKRTIYEQFSFLNDELYAKKRGGKCNVYNSKKQYLHMKDWYLVGSGADMLWSIKQYINTILIMIEKSRKFLEEDGIDINWAAGEIVCGEVLGLNGINAGELGHEFLDRMTIPNRILKIANKDTKQCILDRPHVRVLADSDIPLKEQYKKIIIKENGS